MVKLTGNLHKQLYDHYGDSYITNALTDIRVNKHRAKVVTLFKNDEENKTFIGGSVSDENSFFDKIWNTLSNALKKIYSDGVDAISNIAWKFVVLNGEIPNMIDSLIKILKRAATATGSLILKLTVQISAKFSRLWSYLDSLFKNAGISDALSSLKFETLNIKTVAVRAAQYMTPIISKISAGLLIVMKSIKSLIMTAVQGMSYGAVMLIDMIIVNGYKNSRDGVKEFVLNFGMKTLTNMLAVPDVLSLSKTLSREHIRKTSQRFAKDFVSLAEWTKTSEPFVEKNLGAFDQIRLHVDNAIEWVISNLKWLASTLLSYAGVAHVWFTSFFAAMSPIVASLFGEWIHNTSTFLKSENLLSNAHNDEVAAQNLINRKDLPINVKTDLQNALNDRNEFVAVYNSYKDDIIEETFETNVKTTFSDDDQISNMLLRLLKNEKIANEEINDILKKKTGYTIDGLISVEKGSRRYLQIQILRSVGTVFVEHKKKHDRFLSSIRGKDDFVTIEDTKDKYSIVLNQLEISEKSLAQTFGLLGLEKDPKIITYMLMFRQQMDALSDNTDDEFEIDDVTMTSASQALWNFSDDTIDSKRQLFLQMMNNYYNLYKKKKKLEHFIRTRDEFLRGRSYLVAGILFSLLGVLGGIYMFDYSHIASETLEVVWPTNSTWGSAIGGNSANTTATSSGWAFMGVVADKLKDSFTAASEMIGTPPTIRESFDLKKWIGLSLSMTGIPRLIVPGLMVFGTLTLFSFPIAIYIFAVTAISRVVADSLYEQFIPVRRLEKEGSEFVQKSKTTFFWTTKTVLQTVLKIFDYRKEMVKKSASLVTGALVNPQSLLVDDKINQMLKPSMAMLEDTIKTLTESKTIALHDLPMIIESHHEDWQHGVDLRKLETDAIKKRNTDKAALEQKYANEQEQEEE